MGEKIAGDRVVVYLPLDTSESVLKWINCQKNYGESIRHLIEEDCEKNGIRNLELEILEKKLNKRKNQVITND